MKTWIKTGVLSVAAASMLMVALPAAQARDHWHRHHHRGGGGDAVAAGVIGLATGAIIGGVIANSGPRYEERRYYDAPPPRYYRPQPVYRPAPQPVYREYRGSYEPWTREWYRYCGDRYRSFNPSTGTFVGYDGVTRFCEAN